MGKNSSFINFKFHPNHLIHPGLHGGFDIALSSFGIAKSKSFISDMGTFKSTTKISPSLTTTLKIEPENNLFITGYPVDSEGTMHQIKGKVFDQMSIENGISKLLVFKDLKLAKGMSGSPVLDISENKVQLIGIL